MIETESIDESEESAFGEHSERGEEQRLGGRSDDANFYGPSARRSPTSMTSGGRGTTVHTRNLLAFWLLGLCNNFGYVVMLSAAKDILERSSTQQNDTDRCIDDLDSLPCSPISTGAVLLADILPSLAIKLVAPFTFHGVPYIMRHSLVILCQVTSFIIVAFSTSFSVGLLGVIFASFGAGLGEVTYLSLSSHFHGDVVSSWSSGTGGAGIFGALAFAVLTDRRLLALQPQNALLAMLVVPLLLLWTFWRLLHFPSSAYSGSVSPPYSNTGTVVVTTNANRRRDPIVASRSAADSAHHSVPSSLLPPSTAVATDGFGDYGTANADAITEPLLNTTIHNSNALTTTTVILPASSIFCWNGGRRTAYKIRPLLKYMVPLCVVYFSEYFINQGLLELLVFDCAHSFALSPTSQYRWFQVLYQVGVFFSRSSIKLFPVRIRFIPLLALLQLLNALFLFEESMALHIPHILPLMALVFYEGLLGGLAYVNTFAAIHRNVSKPNREFAMAFVALSDSVGIVLAGFSAISAHNFICAHRQHA
ncbi:hypothetical protein niasHT_023158 [Heterodera trifolii]|uniref:Battenin n=1 Tax=Heterodera trifolii TaxID=157864 RepID=A0ABD2JE16_9BILA